MITKEQREAMRRLGVLDQIEALHQRIVDIWWDGFPSMTLFVFLSSTVLIFAMVGEERLVTKIGLGSFLAAILFAYACVCYSFLRAVIRYRINWKHWPRIGGER